VANWTPKLDFTDDTLLYASFAHGYKAGGANPPGAQLLIFGFQANGGVQGITNPIHPLTFKPEFINAYELGTKNTLLDGALTFNGNVFFYDYKGYQISRIVDRTAINDNFDATVKGAEVEATYEPLPGLRFKFAGGYEHTRIDSGQSSIDLMDRADVANHPDWMVVKPFPTQASNCILPNYVVAALLKAYPPGTANGTVAYLVRVPMLTSLVWIQLRRTRSKLIPFSRPTTMLTASTSTILAPIPVSIRRRRPMAAKAGRRIWAATSFPTRRLSPCPCPAITPFR
jgi:outer membrane receptor protein involved in Fe transport